MFPEHKGYHKAKRLLPCNNGQYHNTSDELFVTVEMELVKLAIESLGFTISFEDAYDHSDTDKNLKSFIWRNLQKSIF